MAEETRPAAGTQCADCWLAGHRCKALVFVGETPLCLACADSEECPLKESALPASWPAVEKIAETMMAMDEEKKPSGWARRLKPEVQEKLRAEITMPTPYLVKKYKVAVVTVQRMKKACGVPTKRGVRGPGRPKGQKKQTAMVQKSIVIDNSATPGIEALIRPEPQDSPIRINLELNAAQAVNIFTKLSPGHKELALKTALKDLLS